MGGKNRTSFGPGNCANPKGRPKKGTALTDILRTYLSKKDPGDPVARKKKLAEELYRRAIGGWVVDPENPERREYVPGSDDLLRYLFNRIDGNPIQALEHTGEDGGPIEVSLSPDERTARIAQLLEKLKTDAAENQ